MTDSIQLYGFGHSDRSGKIRWLANELGIEVEEKKVELGDHRKPEYKAINPFASIPTAVYNGETMIESTACCIHLAELHPESKLAVFAKEPARYEYLKWISICSESFEGRLVDHILANYGLMPEELKAIHEKTLTFKCKVLVEQLPQTGFLVAERFTVADIIACYSLKLAILTGFIEWSQVKEYMSPLMAREAAIKSHFFDGLNDFLSKQ